VLTSAAVKQAVVAVVVFVAASLVASSAVPAKRPVRVGYVTYLSGSGDYVLDAFVDTAADLGLEARVVGVAQPGWSWRAPLVYLARQRFDLIVVGCCPSPGELESIVREFPRVKFLLPDQRAEYVKRPPKNLTGTLFLANEAGYLAGYLAAGMERRRPGRDVIGWVGGYKVAGVDRWAVGYEAGARRADRDITILKTYANSWVNPRKCRTVASSQIARGAGVVFNIAGGCGLGALTATKEHGLWGIGVDTDQSFLGPHILTSAVTRIPVGVRRALEAVKRGTFESGGNRVYGLREEGVGLGRISPKVPPELLRQLEKIRKAIVAGKIEVPTVS
jgi:basic membrane protein A